MPENLRQWRSPFAHTEGSVLTRKRLGVALTRASKAAAISPWPQNGLRHSFCCYAVALRGFEWTAAQADHSVQMLRRHYWEMVTRSEAERYWAIYPN